ncbi:hypothetical protein [Neisseria gonorrhoeae]|nr:hypothetical protein [Neisseria gonorrhoeae]
MFNLVSRWAHKNVLAFKQQGYTVQGWLKEVHYQCMRVNGISLSRCGKKK